MDSQTMVDYNDVDHVKAEKDNAMQRFRRRQNLRWVLKACLPLASISYALYRVDVDPRQLFVAAVNSNLCVFFIINALLVTCFLSGDNKTGEVAESDIYGEYLAEVESVRRSGKESESVTPDDKEIGIYVSSQTTLPEQVSDLEASEIDENVDVETVPFCEDKTVIVEHNPTVVASVSAVTTNNNDNNNNDAIFSDESQKVKSYRRTQSESFAKKSVEPTPKKGLVRSKTNMHRNSEDEPEKLDSVADKLSDEEFQHRCEFFLRKEWQRIHSRPA